MLQSDGRIFCGSIARQIPANREENREFSRFGGFFAKIRAQNMCEFSSLQDEFPAQQNRELIRDNRELIPPYQAGTGNALNRSARGDEAFIPRCRLTREHVTTAGY